MFTHFSFFHLLFNMLWLYWFGSFFLNHFSRRELTGVYFLGGFSGALVYLLCYNLLPFFRTSLFHTTAIGASASVMAVVFAVCCYLPHQRIYVFLIGSIKLIHLALFTAVIDLLSIPSANAGGHIAHLGGALFGCLFIVGIRHHLNPARGAASFSKNRTSVLRKSPNGCPIQETCFANERPGIQRIQKTKRRAHQQNFGQNFQIRLRKPDPRRKRNSF